jgi:hypothetical protein
MKEIVVVGNDAIYFFAAQLIAAMTLYAEGPLMP